MIDSRKHPPKEDHTIELSLSNNIVAALTTTTYCEQYGGSAYHPGDVQIYP